MPITLKKDVWKVKDPSSGQYRGAAILSTTLPEDAAQIISESNAAIQNIKDTAIDAVDTALNDESTGLIPKAEADRDAIDDSLNNASNGIIPTAQSDRDDIDDSLNNINNGIIPEAQANLATIAAAVQSQIGQGTDKTLSVAKGFADAKAAGMMVKVSNYQPGSQLDDPATSQDASQNTGYPVYKDSNRVWVKETYAELEVPTMDDHNELKSALNDANGNQKNYSHVYTDWKLLRNADTQNITDDSVEFTITSGKEFAFRDIYQLGHTPYKNGDAIYIGIHNVNASSTVTSQGVLLRVIFYLDGIENVDERKTFYIHDGTSFFKESVTIPQNVNSMAIGFDGSKLTSLSVGKFIISNRDFESFTLFTRWNPTGIDGIYEDISDIKNELSVKVFDIDSYLYRKYIPSYYYETSDPSSFSGIDYLEEQISTIPNGKHTIFITDTHWDKNQKHSLDLLQYVRGRIGGAPVIFGGDAITAETDKYQAAWLTSQFYSQFVAALGKSFLPVVGNHDTNMAAATASEVSTKYLPFTQMKKLGFDSISDRAVRHIVSDADLQPYSNDQTIRAELIDYFKLTYYIDDDINKIRYIFVNTGNPARGTIYDVFGVSGRTEVMLSIPFIYSAMLTTPSGYDLILTGHMIVGNTVYRGEDVFDNNSGPIKNLLNMLGALKAKDSVSYNQTSISQTTHGWVATGTVTYNFANANDIGRVIVLCGHYHIDAVYVHTYGANPSTATETEWTSGNINQSEQYKIPIILTTTDASGASAYPIIPVSRRIEMENGTILEQAFDVVTLTDNGVTTTRIGAGNSRQIPII